MRIRLLGVLFAMMLSGTHQALACACVTPDEKTRIIDLIAQVVRRADLVFEGEVESIEAVETKVDDGETEPLFRLSKITFKNLRAYKGGSLASLTLHNVGLDCDFPFEVGKKYLVYAHGKEPSWSTSVCDRTTALEEAEADLRFLRGEPPTPDDLITWGDHFDRWRKNLGTICGRVTRTDGKKVEAVIMYLWQAGQAPASQRYTLEWPHVSRGTFVADSIQPGVYFVALEETDENNQRFLGFYGGSSLKEAQNVEARPAPTPCNTNIDLKKRTTYTVGGTVRTTDGSKRPPQDVYIVMDSKDGLTFPPRQFDILESGDTFSLKGIPPGTYEVEAYYWLEKNGLKYGRRVSKPVKVEVSNDIHDLVLQVPPLPKLQVPSLPK